jgi:hypothetical protein
LQHGRRSSVFSAHVIAHRHSRAHGHGDVDACALADVHRPYPCKPHRFTNGHSLADYYKSDGHAEPNRYTRSYEHSLADPYTLANPYALG